MEVICCGGDPMPRAQRWVDPYGVPVRMYGSGKGKLRDHVYALGVVWTILKHRRDFDLIYFLMPGLQVAYGVPLARMLGLSSVMKFSGSNDLSEAQRSTIGPFEIAALRKWSDKIMVLNDAMVEEAMAAGFPREQLLCGCLIRWIRTGTGRLAAMSNCVFEADSRSRRGAHCRFHRPSGARKGVAVASGRVCARGPTARLRKTRVRWRRCDATRTGAAGSFARNRRSCCFRRHAEPRQRSSGSRRQTFSISFPAVKVCRCR